MNAVFPDCALGCDAITVAAAAWLAVRWIAPRLPGLLEPLLAWLWAMGGIVAGSGVVLGYGGLLGPAAFMAAHAAVLAALAFARRRRLAGDAAQLRSLAAGVVGALARRRPEGPPLAALAALLAVLAGLAAFAHPVLYDALTYRLPRIAQWLQDGRIHHYPTGDPRQNYMPVAPDLVMAWLIGAGRDGFRPAALAQCYGGALAMLSTYGIARRTGVSPLGSAGAVALLLGMANVVPQFTTVHTDLFTAGELAAAFCLWACAAQRGEGSVLAGLAAGLAFGSKGTLFYLLPGLAIWLAWTVRLYRPGLRACGATLAGAALSGALFCAPVFGSNLRAYGSVFGPADSVRMVLGGGASDTRPSKLLLNLESSLVQVLDPNSQPPGLREGARALGTALAARLPDQDPFAYGNLDRRAALLEVFARSEPDADSATFGVLALAGLVAAAATAAAAPSRPGAGSVLAWALGIAAFWACFNQLQLWNPYGFRYSALVAPWMAAAAAWWLQALPGPVRRAAWAVSIAAALGVAWAALASTHQAGWRAVSDPAHSRGYFVYSRWREWLGSLDSPAEPLRPALGYNEPVAAFYRLPVPREVRPEEEPGESVRTAEELVRGRTGWVVVAAALFAGREGRVQGRTWLFGGDPRSPFSLAAYRCLRPGEAPAPVLYQSTTTDIPGGVQRSLLVRAWPDGPLRLALRNAGPAACRYTLASPLASQTGILGAASEERVQVAMPAGAVGEVTVRFEAAPGGAAAPAAATVALEP